MDDQEPAAPDNQGVRKTISLTHRQMGVGLSSIVAVTLVLTKMKDFKELITGEQTTAIAKLEVSMKEGFSAADTKTDKQVAELKTLIMAQNEETQHRFERLADKMVDRMRDQDSNHKRDIDRMDHRMDTFEASRNRPSSGKFSN